MNMTNYPIVRLDTQYSKGERMNMRNYPTVRLDTQ
jgi:hypothetical protein